MQNRGGYDKNCWMLALVRGVLLDLSVDVFKLGQRYQALSFFLSFMITTIPHLMAG
jgi:hypothetical protein